MSKKRISLTVVTPDVREGKLRVASFECCSGICTHDSIPKTAVPSGETVPYSGDIISLEEGIPYLVKIQNGKIVSFLRKLSYPQGTLAKPMFEPEDQGLAYQEWEELFDKKLKLLADLWRSYEQQTDKLKEKYIITPEDFADVGLSFLASGHKKIVEFNREARDLITKANNEITDLWDIPIPPKQILVSWNPTAKSWDMKVVKRTGNKTEKPYKMAVPSIIPHLNYKVLCEIYRIDSSRWNEAVSFLSGYNDGNDLRLPEKQPVDKDTVIRLFGTYPPPNKGPQEYRIKAILLVRGHITTGVVFGPYVFPSTGGKDDVPYKFAHCFRGGKSTWNCMTSYDSDGDIIY